MRFSLATLLIAFLAANARAITATPAQQNLRRHALRTLRLQPRMSQGEDEAFHRELRDEQKPVLWVAAGVEAPIAAHSSDAPSMTPSDMPSTMPSDMPSTMPSDQPSLSPISWEETETSPPPPEDESGADAALMAEESSSKSLSGESRKLVLPLSIGLGASLVALMSAFVIFRLRRRSLAEGEVRMDDTNVAFLEEGVTPRAPSPVAASNQFDSQFSELADDDSNSKSKSKGSSTSSHGMSNYQMSDVGDLDSKLSGSLLGEHPQLSNTVTL